MNLQLILARSRSVLRRKHLALATEQPTAAGREDRALWTNRSEKVGRAAVVAPP